MLSDLYYPTPRSVFHVAGSLSFRWSSHLHNIHVFFENIMTQLLSVWEGSYKSGTLNNREGDKFVIDPQAWAAMSQHILDSNATVPTQTARVFKALLTVRGSWTAETHSYLLLFLGPIVLASRLPEPYYGHFLQLSTIAKFRRPFSISIT